LAITPLRRSTVAAVSDASEQTVADRARLEQELSRLRTERSRLRASLGGEDPDDPDVGDSGDQSQALEGDDDLARIGQRIREVEHLIASPDPQAGLADGTIVTLRFAGGDVVAFRVVAIAEEAGTDEVITSDSPLGRALIGRKAGDTLTYKGPDGELQAEVVDVRPPVA
jgi:transcription elongation factor GreA